MVWFPASSIQQDHVGVTGTAGSRCLSCVSPPCPHHWEGGGDGSACGEVQWGILRFFLSLVAENYMIKWHSKVVFEYTNFNWGSKVFDSDTDAYMYIQMIEFTDSRVSHPTTNRDWNIAMGWVNHGMWIIKA